MSNPSGPDHPDATEPVEQPASDDGDAETPETPDTDTPDVQEAPTEVMAAAEPEADPTQHIEVAGSPAERRYTAPGFDAGSTQIIDRAPEPATEVISAPTEPVPAQSDDPPRRTGPQEILPRTDVPRPPTRRRSWGWVVALILVIAALAAVAILGTVLLTRDNTPKVSQEDMVRTTIQNFDTAVQKGDLATLRSITCGSTRDSYVNYDDRAWADTHARVAAAKQYPVVASIDQVVINNDHAEANVTTFMAFDPATRSTRSFDLQFRDEQWKICQAPDN